jgi:hypothetical protein
VLREWRRSGKSASAFARERGVSVRRLSYWAKQLSSANESRVRFVPVTLAEAKTPCAAVIEIEHGGVTVRVRESVDVELVGRLLAVVVRAVRPC